MSVTYKPLLTCLILDTKANLLLKCFLDNLLSSCAVWPHFTED